MGQIWAVLILSDEALCASDLVDVLSISKGSVSTNIRTLESMGVLERRSRIGARQEYFYITSNPYSALIHAQIARVDRTKQIVSDARARISKPATRSKLAEFERFYGVLHEKLFLVADELKATSEDADK